MDTEQYKCLLVTNFEPDRIISCISVRAKIGIEEGGYMDADRADRRSEAKLRKDIISEKRGDDV